MADEREVSVSLSGLVDAGKSTWLAALWQVFETDDFDSELSLEAYLGDQRYIVELNRRWTRCQHFERTPIKSPGTVEVTLRDPEGVEARLEIPDLSGELFQEHWKSRHWEPEFDRDIQAADGLLLMASTLTKGVLMLRDLNALSMAAGEEEDGETGESVPDVEQKANGQEPKWDPNKSPDQVQLVEHLQFVALRRSGRPLPVALMLGAWDQVRAAGLELSPEEWLAQELPLLDQYLKANRDLFPSAVYGVSAQGGDLEKDREKLLSMAPIERLEVVEGTRSSSDLTAPLAWVIGAANDG
jgi:Double-GTPase 1